MNNSIENEKEKKTAKDEAWMKERAKVTRSIKAHYARNAGYVFAK